MSKSLARKMARQLDDTVEDVLSALHQAADELSEEAETAIAEAAKALCQACDAVRSGAPRLAHEVAAKATKEIKDHPIASTAAALSAAAALITLLGRERKAR